MKKKVSALVACLVLMAHQVWAVESRGLFDVGIGVLYSGIGVGVGLRSDSDFKYFALGCPGIGNLNNSG